MEILIDLSSHHPALLTLDFMKDLSELVERNNIGAADYELRSLMAQLLFNMKREQMVMIALNKSARWKGILHVTHGDFQNGVDHIILGFKDIDSVMLTEISYNARLYNSIMNEQASNRVYFNQSSVTVNVHDPVSEEIVMIELLYSSIKSCSVHCEGMIQCVVQLIDSVVVDLIGRKSLITLELHGGQSCVMIFPDVRATIKAEKMIEKHTSLQIAKKSSTCMKDQLSQMPCEIREREELAIELGCRPDVGIITPPATTDRKMFHKMEPKARKLKSHDELSSCPVAPLLDLHVNKLAHKSFRLTERLKKKLKTIVKKQGSLAFKMAGDNSIALLRNPFEHDVAYEPLMVDKWFPEFPSPPTYT